MSACTRPPTQKSSCGWVLSTWSGSGRLPGPTYREDGRQSFVGVGSLALHKSSPVLLLTSPPRCEAPQHGTELWWHYFMNQVFLFVTSSQLTRCDFVHSLRTSVLGTSCSGHDTFLSSVAVVFSRLLTAASTDCLLWVQILLLLLLAS